MTLQQLRYITMVAEKGTISEAAKELFISQPSLTNAIREPQREMNFSPMQDRFWIRSASCRRGI